MPTFGVPYEPGQQLKLSWQLLQMAPIVIYLYSLHNTRTQNKESRALAQPVHREDSLWTYLKVTCVKIDNLVQHFTSSASQRKPTRPSNQKNTYPLVVALSQYVQTKQNGGGERNGGSLFTQQRRQVYVQKKSGQCRSLATCGQNTKSRNGCSRCFFD